MTDITTGAELGFKHLTIGATIRAAARRDPTKTALIFEERTLDYAALIGRINGVANFGTALGLEFGDVVAVLAPNCLEYIELVVGLSDIGATVATLNPRYTAGELAMVVDDCQPRLIVVHPACEKMLTPDVIEGRRVVVLGDDYEALIAQAGQDYTPPAIAETHSFALSYTSGTTGKPKGVLLAHRGRTLAFFIMQAEYGCFGPEDHFLALAPQYHGAGLCFSLAPLAFGGTCTVLGHFDAEATVRRIAEGDISGIFMVPTHFFRIFSLPAEVLKPLQGRHGLRAIISNAAALPQPLKEKTIAQFGEGLLHECYGSTESGFVLNIRPPDQLRKQHSVGKPFAGMEVELRDDAGHIVPAGTPGELFARGPTTFNGYLNRPEETAEAVQEGGWVTVGDIAVRDDEGFHYIVDRKKDMIVSGGVNVYPREIENVIVTLPGISEVAVVGLPDSEWGERVHAFVVTEAGVEPEAAPIMAACRTQLAGYKIPRGISFIDALPRNAGGKVLKRDLRDRGA